MSDERASIGLAYLERLSDTDLALLVGSTDLAGGAADALRAEPGRLLGLLESRESFEAVFASLDGDAELTFVSPFCVFALCIHRAAAELAGASYVTEWFGPRRRTPVFDVADLREFLAGPARRLFLVELLSSFTHVRSGSVLVRTPRGLRRQRFSDLDPVRLAGLLDVVPEHDRAGVYRRLGDVAVFLTGVFPDHTALAGLSDIDKMRLLRASGARPARVRELAEADIGAVELLGRLGPRWYRLADAAEHLVELPGSAPSLLGELAHGFAVGRRILNVVTDSFLFRSRSRMFGIGA